MLQQIALGLNFTGQKENRNFRSCVNQTKLFIHARSKIHIFLLTVKFNPKLFAEALSNPPLFIVSIPTYVDLFLL